ncbi:hypothetical protein CEUSTIGMA_g6175.t1 [Chlamydomonas eustigma]|uniref:Guanylate cyclase domain-containing protein n=1 Tax=Chlamydomonas eustigma TaxID=1157962 RepID=A0A250X6N1_9CHLO|nr:hypothetical protein CEUSTIGMA_g6175.t1 [Chlamydomonas eustigma]|eukprot:GAX78738.1 hypothetical protein CEUSTIGMA_g6175.t1 [Chlamydomonas eustigma]
MIVPFRREPVNSMRMDSLPYQYDIHLKATNRLPLMLLLLTVAEFTWCGLLRGTNAASCSTAAQHSNLLLLYNYTRGSNWYNNTGWASIPYQNISSASAQSGSCFWYQFVASSTSTMSSPPVLLPDYCCWFGVTCCNPSSCLNVNSNSTCTCPTGFVSSLSLRRNNLSGQLLAAPVSLWSTLSCSLVELDLGQNTLSGSLPPQLSALSSLTHLDLSFNELTGQLPSSPFDSMGTLQWISLSGNNLTGTIPSNLCYLDNSLLTTLFLAGNLFSGQLNLSSCSNLFSLDVTGNLLTSIIPPTSNLNNLQLAEAGFNNLTSVFYAKNVLELNMAFNTEINETFPLHLASMQSLKLLNCFNTNFSGTLPEALFQLGSLTYLVLANNFITGTIPQSLREAVSLSYLDMSNNSLTGTIPDGVVTSLARLGQTLNLRLNYMSCCGSNFIHDPTYSNCSYKSYNKSAPKLPKGLAFSTYLQPVITEVAGFSNYVNANLGNSTYPGLNCPYLKLETDPDEPDYLLDWTIDPEYFLFEGCQCGLGYLYTTHEYNGLKVVQCISMAQIGQSQLWWQSMPWDVTIIAAGVVITLAGMVWFFVFRKGSRLQVLQNMIDMHKRLKGAPTSGMVSIVVTDIEGFSNLMKRAPELTMRALLIHNNVIDKARTTNFGHILEQEGDSYAVAFEDAADAVKFCLQAQQLLSSQRWPKGLFLREVQEQVLKSKPSGVFAAGLERMKSIVRIGLANTPTPSHPQHALDGTESAAGPRTSSRSERGGTGPGRVHTAASGVLELIERKLSEMRKSTGSQVLVGSDGEGEAALSGRGSAAWGSSAWSGIPSSRRSLVSSGRLAGSSIRGGMGSKKSLLRADASGKRFFSGSSRIRSARFAPETVSPQQSIRLAASSVASSLNVNGGMGASGMRDSGGSEAESSAGSFSGAPNKLGVSGLRVRMGVATGMVSQGQGICESSIMEAAKLVSDAGAGGQVLLDASTFLAVKDLTAELGCVTKDGLEIDGMERPQWWKLWAGNKHKGNNGAQLLDMGEYMYRPSAAGDVLILSDGDMAMDAQKPSANVLTTASEMSNGANPQKSVDRVSRSGFAKASVADANKSTSNGRLLRLYQVLAPSLKSRGQIFGSKLRLKPGWVCVDEPYFNAPGLVNASSERLLSAKKVHQNLTGGPVTSVFCMADGGKQYSSRYRKDSQAVNKSLVAILKSVQRQVSCGYFVKQYDGELKYMLAFKHLEDALHWCMLVQECILYADWPLSALKFWPIERDNHGQAIFRGPRLKIGVSEGVPSSVLPDHMGRADYLGASVNQAARFMDAAAHGGQVVCCEDVALRVMKNWSSLSKEPDEISVNSRVSYGQALKELGSKDSGESTRDTAELNDRLSPASPSAHETPLASSQPEAVEAQISVRHEYENQKAEKSAVIVAGPVLNPSNMDIIEEEGVMKTSSRDQTISNSSMLPQSRAVAEGMEVSLTGASPRSSDGTRVRTSARKTAQLIKDAAADSGEWLSELGSVGNNDSTSAYYGEVARQSNSSRRRVHTSSQAAGSSVDQITVVDFVEGGSDADVEIEPVLPVTLFRIHSMDPGGTSPKGSSPRSRNNNWSESRLEEDLVNLPGSTVPQRMSTSNLPLSEDLPLVLSSTGGIGVPVSGALSKSKSMYRISEANTEGTEGTNSPFEAHSVQEIMPDVGVALPTPTRRVLGRLGSRKFLPSTAAASPLLDAAPLQQIHEQDALHQRRHDIHSGNWSKTHSLPLPATAGSAELLNKNKLIHTFSTKSKAENSENDGLRITVPSRRTLQSYRTTESQRPNRGPGPSASTPSFSSTTRTRTLSQALNNLFDGDEEESVIWEWTVPTERRMPGIWVEIVCTRLGLFRFKGSSEVVPMVNILPTWLSDRKFPSEPPAGKGERVEEDEGILGFSYLPMMQLVKAYRVQYEVLRSEEEEADEDGDYEDVMPRAATTDSSVAVRAFRKTMGVLKNSMRVGSKGVVLTSSHSLASLKGVTGMSNKDSVGGASFKRFTLQRDTSILSKSFLSAAWGGVSGKFPVAKRSTVQPSGPSAPSTTFLSTSTAGSVTSVASAKGRLSPAFRAFSMGGTVAREADDMA